MTAIGIIADTHIGSAFGPWPPKMQLSTGGRYQLNKGQRYINKHWYTIAETMPHLDILILNGDIIDGQQPKDMGRYVCEADPQFQARAALELLRPYLAKSGKVYATEGTEYHEGEAATWAEWLAREVGAIPRDSHFAWDWLLLDAAGLHLDIAHRQSFFLRYRATGLEREMQFSAMMESTADVIVRSHTHHYILLQMPCDSKMQTAISTPAWQLQTHYARTSISPSRLLNPILGMVVVNMDGGEVHVKPYAFPHPPQRRERYETA